MRILQANKFFYLKGGAERYLFDLIDGLGGAGHEVIPFSMRHSLNVATPYSEHFVPEVDFHANGSLWSRLRRARGFVYSREARTRLRDLVSRGKPNVAHFHNIAHQLTPSILDEARRAGIPVVQTLHDYKLICSSYLLFANGEVCERCAGGRHYQAVLQRCHHGSLGMSMTGFAEMSFHALRRSYDGVSLFLCPSRFMQRKCASFGIAPERLVHCPYFLVTARYRPDPEPGDYALYMGRLSREKGVSTLISAAGRTGGLPLVVLGDGPLREGLEREAIHSGASIRFEGHLQGSALHDRVRGSAFVIVPSEWYENLPYAILEAFALGKPVLGSRIGGIPELVRDGETGWLFEPRNAVALAERWRGMWQNRAGLKEMGRNARRRAEREYEASQHLARITDIYRSVAA